MAYTKTTWVNDSEPAINAQNLNHMETGIADAHEALESKVDVIEGKGLSTEDYTTAEKTKLSGIQTGAQVNTVTGIKGNSEENYRTGNVNITKGNIGLGNVDNTSDADKPVSTATQAALNGKVNTEAGKGLSTEDYTSEEKTKLGNIAAGAQVNVIETVKVNNIALTPSNKAVNVDLSDYATKADIASVYKYKGTVSTYADLPDTGLTVGDVYNVETADATHGIKAGDNLAWNGSAWDVLAGTVDLSAYATKSEVQTGLAGKQDTLTFDSAPIAGSTNPVTSGGIKTALDGKQNSLTFDNVPTENSANPVKSGGVYSALAEKQALLGVFQSIESDGYLYNNYYEVS